VEKFSVSDVVFVDFPFSNLKKSKLRPAVILASVQNNDWILCQVTSKSYADESSLKLLEKDFKYGSLNLVSYIRPGKIFTAHESWGQVLLFAPILCC
jgi:mRNA interferase MazF